MNINRHASDHATRYRSRGGQGPGGERGWWWARLAHHGAQESPEVATATPKLHACVPADIKMFRQIAKCMHARANVPKGFCMRSPFAIAYRRRLHTDAVCTQTIVRTKRVLRSLRLRRLRACFPFRVRLRAPPPACVPPTTLRSRSLPIISAPPLLQYLRRQPRDTVSLGSAREKRRVLQHSNLRQ